MKKTNILLAIAIIICSCKTKPKEYRADNRGPNDGKEPFTVITKKDTINVLEYIEMANEPQQQAAGGGTEKIQSKTIVTYDDSNMDTIKATILFKGVIHPPAIGNPPPGKPFERLEKYIFCKIKGDWNAVKIVNTK